MWQKICRTLKTMSSVENKTRNVNLRKSLVTPNAIVCNYVYMTIDILLWLPFCTFFIKLRPTFGIVLPLNTKAPVVHKARGILVHSTQLWVYLLLWVCRFCSQNVYIHKHMYKAYIHCWKIFFVQHSMWVWNFYRNCLNICFH